MRTLLQTLKNNVYIVLLIVAEVALFTANYKAGTFFVGWDNLLPELNFSENIKRSFFAIWQEYRGLGLLDGMSFAANLPHYLFIFVLSFFLPQNILRYTFIFLMHLVGGLGMYHFLKCEILETRLNKKIFSFFGAIFYMFNLATIQMFYAPYELFTIHFAFLPWLIYYAISYVRIGSKRKLLSFAIFSIFAIPQAHVPTIFLVYLLTLFVVLLFQFLRRREDTLRRLIAIFTTVFLINAFWILPFTYSAMQNRQIVINAKINEMSSADIYLKNRARGTFSDVLTLKGFMLDMIELRRNGQNNYIMPSWRSHITSPYFLFPSLIFLSIAFLGIALSIKKEKKLYPYLLLALASFIFLANDSPVVRLINDYLRSNISLFAEVFRFSFTKFAILFTLTYTIFFSVGLAALYNYLNIRYRNKKILFLLLGSLLFISYSFPSFLGNFLYGDLRVTVPKEYFETINYFKIQDRNTRIATFPQPYYWSWRFYKWGSKGSGFLWYGIQQATLDRSFDPWSDKNENYYWEISYALYSKNLLLFEKILEKYQINWLFIDKNIINPASYKSLFFDELKEMISKSPKILLAKQFGNIEVYQVNLETPVKNFVFLAQNLPAIGPNYHWTNLDQAFLENGNYISEPQNTKSQLLNTYFPFRSLFSGQKPEEREFNLEETTNSLIFKKVLPQEARGYLLKNLPKEKITWPDPDHPEIKYDLTPEIKYDNKILEVKIPKVTLPFLQIDPTKEKSVLVPKNCNQFSQGKAGNKVIQESGRDILELKSQNAYNCSTAFWLPNLAHKYAYLISVESRNIKGKSLLFWLENLNIRKADMEVYLPTTNDQRLTTKLTKSYFIQPPMEVDGVGYSLHLDNISIGNQEVVNDLGKIAIYPIPYNFLTSLSLIANTITSKSNYIAVESTHPNPSLYIVHPGGVIASHLRKSDTLVLSQSYEIGWQAYEVEKNTPWYLAPISGKKLNHKLVNNWQNGWDLSGVSSKSKIVILFLPQFLEYFGFLLLPIPLLIIKFTPTQ